jgi:hypothetical protein
MKIKQIRFITILFLLLLLYSCGDKPALNPKFPIIEGEYIITKDKKWKIYLPEKYNIRFEDKKLVIWKPGLTILTTAWNNPKNESSDKRLADWKLLMDKKAYDIVEIKKDDRLIFSYRLNELREQNEKVYALYGMVFKESGLLQIAIYFDIENDFRMAKELFDSLE